MFQNYHKWQNKNQEKHKSVGVNLVADKGVKLSTWIIMCFKVGLNKKLNFVYLCLHVSEMCSMLRERGKKFVKWTPEVKKSREKYVFKKWFL